MVETFTPREFPAEIAPGVFAVDRRWGAWSYLLVGDETLIVDTGPPGRATSIVRSIERAGVDPKSVDRIVLTHFDVDHSGSALALQALVDAPVAIHPDDAPYLAAPEACAGMRKFLYWPWFTWALRWRPPVADQLIQEGDVVGGWTVLHTPGHTPGSISLLRDDVAVVGDAVVCHRGRLRPNVRYLATDWPQQLASTRRLTETGARTVLPGHYSPCTNPDGLRALRARLDRMAPDAA